MGQLNGNENTTEPNVIKNKYLNLASLAYFWGKVSRYIINSQETQTTTITNTYTAEDNAIRDFIGKMSINGHPLAKYTAGATNTAGTLALEDDLTIDSSEVPLTNASKTALGNTVQTVDDGLIQLDTRMDAIDQSFTILEGKIAALASAIEFKGVVNWDPSSVTILQVGEDDNNVPLYKITDQNNDVVDTAMQNGDIVIHGHKEYILDGTHLKFVELGDVTAVQTQLTEIQDWINNPATEEEIDDLFNEDQS